MLTRGDGDGDARFLRCHDYLFGSVMHLMLVHHLHRVKYAVMVYRARRSLRLLWDRGSRKAFVPLCCFWSIWGGLRPIPHRLSWLDRLFFDDLAYLKANT